MRRNSSELLLRSSSVAAQRKIFWILVVLLLLFTALTLALPAMRADQTPAPATGTIEFTARVQPTGGRPEPVRQLAIFLLRKSYAEIQAEAEKTAPRPDMDKFIESLNVSPKLKEWMKRTRCVQLNGPEFLRQLKTNDVLDVPEFFEAYIAQNAGDTTIGFPASRAKDADQEKNPQKYEKDKKEYHEALRKFIENKSYTRDAIEVRLMEINPAQRWSQQEAERKKRVRYHAAELAEITYLVARIETDVEGKGAFAGVPAGDYWISSLDAEALAGDARLRWDVQVPVRAARTTRLILSNVNAVQTR